MYPGMGESIRNLKHDLRILILLLQFHLACVGLTATPKGQWYCDECLAKRKQRNNKNGKKRAGGGGRANQRGNGV